MYRFWVLRKLFKGHISFCEDLLSNWSQFLTFVFQSHVWRSRSKASPVGHLTDANLVTPLASELKSHLNFIKNRLVDYYLVDSLMRRSYDIIEIIYFKQFRSNKILLILKRWTSSIIRQTTQIFHCLIQNKIFDTVLLGLWN